MEGGNPLKKILLIAILSLLTVLSFGLDFGGNIDNVTIFSNSSSSDFYQQDKLSVWISTELSTNLDFLAQGSYTFSTEEPYYFDLDFLNVSGEGTSPFRYTVGRFYSSDFTGKILNHKLDGISLIFDSPKGILSITAGYTGMLFTDSSSVIMSKADESDSTDEDVIFAAPRLIGGMNLLLPESFFRQDLNISFWLQKDLRGKTNLVSEGTLLLSDKGGTLDTQYTGLGLNGPIVPSLYYDTFAYLGTGTTMSYINGSYSYKSILSFLSGFGLRYYAEELLFSKLAFDFLYSSGDSDYTIDFTEGNTDDTANIFRSISRPYFALIFSPQIGNIFMGQLSYSIKPFSYTDNKALTNIQTEIKASGFFRSSTGQISEAGLDPDSDELYLGTEIDSTINFRPFSDFGLSISGGIFLPNTASGGAFLKAERDIEFIGKAEFSFSF